MNRFILILLILSSILALSACGGGDSADTKGPSDWDSMVWGQDNWA